MNEEKRTLIADEKTPSTISSVKGIAAMCLVVFVGSGSRICVQALDGAVPDFELNSFRCGCAAFGMMLYFIVTRSFPWIPRENLKEVVVFSIVTNLLQLTLYIAAAVVPLASAECVKVTLSIITGLLVFTLINKEKLRWDMLLSVPMCVVGVTLVLQPPFIFHPKENSLSHLSKNNNQTINNFPENTTNVTEYNQSLKGIFNQTEPGEVAPPLDKTLIQLFGLSMSALSGVFTVLEVSVVKYYNKFFTTENVFRSLVWAHLAGAILSLVVMAIFEKPTFPTDAKDILLVFLHGGFHIFLLPALCYSSHRISGMFGSLIRSLYVLAMLCAQYTVLRHIHPGHRNWIEVVGVIVVLLGTIESSVSELLQGFLKK